ncbi:ABC transporter ATP-binding protein/permease [Falcatimonas sp. MSJ-15]|uniref:ABC transporter ATP-binding protein n=1 Tax=Falcatimonas sp. MSJ-15 TaxID=2841515 RepID=UPI001C120918|nr:ABC transporter ATP-binding protein [Falcatimonas sp. MSJ-15]MBU5470182.1 ABC transporter ATP-binding protein/permease [Falcatimonas sp. MSJ-15]
MASRNTYFKDEEIEKKVDIKQFGRIIKYIIPYKNMFILVSVLMLIGAVASTVSPLLLKEIINKTVITEDYRQLVLIITGLIVLSAIEIAITYIHQVLMGSAGHNIIARIREEVFYKLQELPFDYFDSKPDGKIVVRVTDYVNDLANFFTNYVVLFVVYIVKIIVVTIFMLMISPQLTLVVLITVVPMMICVFALRKVIRKLFTLQRVKNSNRSAFLVESIMGEKIAKNYNRTQENKSIYERIHNDSVQYWLKIFYRNELNTPIVEIFWNIGTLLLYGTALFLMLHGDTNVNAGVVVAFTSYMSLFSGPITQIAVIIQQLAQVSSNLEQVFDTIDYPVDIRDKKDSIVLQNVKGQVDFDNIDFAYEEGINILENFNLHVKPGETIALVGPTGAGKTTVINMITRFYDVKKGSVKIDGIDVRDVTMESLRREVGVLMQDPFIFKGTIMDNIRYGRPDATDEECIEASKTIFADKFISRLSDGYYHVLEERGNGLSAGEKQLLSFARIILKNPSVIILDEATSSIDTETENLIQQALDIILRGKTAFIVAHRLSTIRNADRILYIANKGIAEEGSHAELMAKKGLYYALN